MKIIIVNSNYRNYFLQMRKEKADENFKLVTREELFSMLSYVGNDASLIYLNGKGYSFANAKEILDNLKFLKLNVSPTCDKLIKIRDELIEKKLLSLNLDYLYLLKNNEILLPQYLKNDKELLNLLNYYQLSYDYLKESDEKSISYYEFTTREEEIRYLIEQIGEDISKNIPLNKIKVILNDDDYVLTLQKFNSLLPFSFVKKNDLSYYYHEDYRYFIKNLDLNDIEGSYKKVLPFIKDQVTFNQLISNYIRVKNIIKKENIISYFDFLAGNIHYQLTLDNIIEIISFDDLKIDDVAYLVNFNSDNYPKADKDNDYLSDFEKERLSLNTTFDNKIIEENKFKYLLRKYPNLKISYAKKNKKEEFKISPLLNNQNLKQYNFLDVYYSSEYRDYFLAKCFDDFYNYSFKSPYIIDKNEKDYSYKTYSHAYKKFNYQPTSLITSYSSLKIYYQCAFAYYLKSVLKLNKYEEILGAKIGNIAHQMMENLAKGEKCEFADINKDDLNLKEKTIIANLEYPLNYALDNQKVFLNDTPLKQLEAEDDSYQYFFDDKHALMGKIDLICNNDNYYIIVDYKTNDEKFVPSELKYGFSMQLVIYYLLLKNSKYSNLNIIGAYIKPLLNKDYFKGKYSYLRLNGITIDDPSLVEGEGKYIAKGKKIKETDSYTKVIRRDEFESYVRIAYDVIKDAFNKIDQGEFTINPKIFNGKENCSCKYCNFKDICYHTFEDNVYFDSEEEEEEE